MADQKISDEVLNRIKTLQMEIEQLDNNLSAIEQQTALIAQVIDSLNNANRTLNELKLKKSGDEILVPIGGSNYILCKIKEPNKTFISLGSGISLLDDRNNTEERNNTQVQSLEKSINQLQEQYSRFSQMINDRRQEMVKIAQKYELIT
jgi:prefoldin alpha subunit